MDKKYLVTTAEYLARKYGEDRAHDIVVKVLESRKPIKSLKTWAARCHMGLSANEFNRNPRLVNFSDLNRGETEYVRSLGHLL